jgi:hypothetical protein
MIISRKASPCQMEAAFFFPNADLPEHPLYGMIRSEPVKGSV